MISYYPISRIILILLGNRKFKQRQANAKKILKLRSEKDFPFEKNLQYVQL